MSGYITKIKAKQPVFIHRIPIDVYHTLEKTDLPTLIRTIESEIPRGALDGVKKINFGKFQELDDRNISAFATDSQIFISNELELNLLIRALMHELAHFVVDRRREEIFEDGELEREFLGKRRFLYDFLKQGNKPQVSIKLFNNPRYSQKLDDFFYKEIGYDYIEKINNRYGLGPTPYSLTSLEEYFADGFEFGMLGHAENYKNTCKVLFNKVESVLSNL